MVTLGMGSEKRFHERCQGVKGRYLLPRHPRASQVKAWMMAIFLVSSCPRKGRQVRHHRRKSLFKRVPPLSERSPRGLCVKALDDLDVA
jgi:hypothetical protein